MSHNALIAVGLYVTLIGLLLIPQLVGEDPVEQKTRTLPKAITRLFPPSARWEARRQALFLLAVFLVSIGVGELALMISHRWQTKILSQNFLAQFRIETPASQLALTIEEPTEKLSETTPEGLEFRPASETVLWDPLSFLSSLAYFEEFSPSEKIWFSERLPKLSLPDLKLEPRQAAVGRVPLELHMDPSEKLEDLKAAKLFLSRPISPKLYQTEEKPVYAITPLAKAKFIATLKARDERWAAWLIKTTMTLLIWSLLPLTLALLNFLYLKRSHDLCRKIEEFKNLHQRGIPWQALPEAKLKLQSFWLNFRHGPHTYRCKIKVSSPPALGKATKEVGLVYYRGTEKQPKGRFLRTENLQVFIPDAAIADLH